MAHDEHEIAIEKRLHGALAPTEIEVLERHLSECQDCREYEISAHAGMEGVRNVFAAQSRSTNWSLVQERVESQIRSARRSRYLLPLGFVAFLVLQAAIGIWDRGRLFPSLFSFAVVAPLMALFFYRLARYQLRSAESRLAEAGALTFYREALDRAIRDSKLVVYLTPPAVVGLAACLWIGNDRELWAMTMIFAPAWLALGAWSLWVKLPRLLREREELR